MIIVDLNRLNDSGTALSEDKSVYLHATEGGRWVRPWMKETLRIKSPGYKTIDGVRYIWVLPQSKKAVAVAESLRRDSRVMVYQVFTKSRACTDSCKVAEIPVFECECSCLGSYHGLVPVGTKHATEEDKEHARRLAEDKSVVVASETEYEVHIHTKYIQVRSLYIDGVLNKKEIFDKSGHWKEVPVDFVWKD